MQVHVHHARSHEQAQLDQGVVDHVHHAAIGRQGALLSQEYHHAQPHGDEADLAHGGAGQRALEIHAEQRQQRAQEHGDGGEHQQRVAEGRIARHDVRTDDDCVDYRELPWSIF